jgi:hypothetical protein
LSRYHNSLLRRRIKVLRSKYPHTTIISTEYYRPFIAFLHEPAHFRELSSPLNSFFCCKSNRHCNMLSGVLTQKYMQD